MEKFSLPEFELCAQRIYCKDIIECDYSGIFDRLNSILSKCNNYPENDYIEIVFRKYIYLKTATDTFRSTQNPKGIKKSDDITQTIIFKQSSDMDINILAKVKCLRYGGISSGRKDFLEWQINKLLLSGNFDMLEEYKLYKKEKSIEEYIIPDIITRNFN